jgi:hypothetical protein
VKEDVTFDYTAVLPTAGAKNASGLIAYLEPIDGPLQAVVWSAAHGQWIYAPGPAARILYDDQQFDHLRDVDRRTAELVAREDLGTQLPTEETLSAICAEGQRSGLVYGPPRA